MLALIQFSFSTDCHAKAEKPCLPDYLLIDMDW